MFGYIRPLKNELKIREFEQFKACYCALCHVLAREYGQASRFILNYDFTFLAMLLWQEDSFVACENKRCIVSPFRKKCVCVSSPSLELCAGLSLILAYWKLQDSIADNGFFQSIPARLGAFFLRRAYRKAAERFSSFDRQVVKYLTELSALEKAGEPSLDKMADKFALLLRAAAERETGEKEMVVSQMLYHMGRWIYIVDAIHDLEEDYKDKRYNPVSVRFGLCSYELSEEEKEYLKTTLIHSENMITSAYELLPYGAWTDIIKNIIYLGMPDVCDKVLNGTFENTKPKKGLPR